MRLDKLAITAQEAFQNSMGVASDAESAVIQPIHLLKALLDADENNLAAIIKRIGADPAQLERNVNEEVERGPKSQGGMPMPMPGNDLMKTIDNAVKVAEKLGDSYATSEHLLIALSEDKGPAGRILNGVGITRKNIEAAYEELRGDTRVTDQQEKAQFEALEQYGQNLTQQAREGKLDPVIGRSEEIRRTIQVLSRRTKNNPVLIGEPGTGKTAIVEGLAQRIVARLGRDDGGREIPRRVRGPLEGGAARGEAVRGQGYLVHRRAAYHRGRRLLGRQHARCGQHA